MKTKIKFYDDEVTDFCNKKIPKMDSNHTCSALISLDSAFKEDENYYPQVFLKECFTFKNENTFKKVFLKVAILKLFFFFFFCEGAVFEKVFFKSGIFKMYLLRVQFWKCIF